MRLHAMFFSGENEPATAHLQRFRKRLFVDGRGWDLDVKDGREIDQFDTSRSIHLMLSDGQDIVGTFRATRTDQPYLSADVFRQLASVHAYPHRKDVFEISRFGIMADGDTHRLALVNYALMFLFAERIGASALVAVAELPYERFLRSLGIRTRRYGPPQTIGTDPLGRPLQVVAGEIPVALQHPRRLAELASHLSDVEIHDDSHVFGPARVSA